MEISMKTIREELENRIISVEQTPKQTKFIVKCYTPGCQNTAVVEKRKHLPGRCKSCAYKVQEGQIKSDLINSYKHLLHKVTKNKHNKPVYSFYCSTEGCENTVKCRRASLVKHPPICKDCQDVEKSYRPHEALWLKLQKSAKKRGLECSLTYEECFDLCNIPTCEYCGEDLKRTVYKKHKQKDGPAYRTALIDRKDSSIGYTKDNCVSCCWYCNNLKSNRFTHDEFLKLRYFIKR
jgi:hypothetical protein